MPIIKRRRKLDAEEKQHEPEENPHHHCSTADNTTHWDRITNSGARICFVCDKKFRIHQSKVYVGKHKFTEESLFRHDYCETGSSNWNKKFGGRLWHNKKEEEAKAQAKAKAEQEEPPVIIKRRRTSQEEQPAIIKRRGSTIL